MIFFRYLLVRPDLLCRCFCQLRAVPTVGAQVQGELIRLSHKQTLHSCSFQHTFRKKPHLFTDDHASSSLWVSFSFYSKPSTFRRSLPTLMSPLSFGHVYAWPNDIILFWLALVNGQMTRCICRGVAPAEEEPLCAKVGLLCMLSWIIFVHVVEFFFSVWCQTLQMSSCDLLHGLKCN